MVAGNAGLFDPLLALQALRQLLHERLSQARQRKPSVSPVHGRLSGYDQRSCAQVHDFP